MGYVEPTSVFPMRSALEQTKGDVEMEFENSKFSVIWEPSKGTGKVYRSGERAMTDLKEALREDRKIEILLFDLSKVDEHSGQFFGLSYVSWETIASKLAKGEM